MKKIILFVIFYLIFVIPVFSFDMILTGDPVLEDIRFLSLETGLPFLSYSPPFSPAEIKLFLDSVNKENLSIAAVEAYNRVQNRLSPVTRLSYSNEIFSLLFNLNSSLEGIARFNPDVPLYPRYPKITPLISLPLRGSFANTVQFYIEPMFAVNPQNYGEEEFDINIPFSYDETSHNLTVRAFAAAGGNWWNFQIGRDRLYWGSGRTGSLTFSDYAPYFDFARLSFFSSTVKYSMIVNQMPLTLTDKLFSDNGDNYYPSNWNHPDNLQSTLQRYFYLHRIDFTLFDKVNIGLMEGIMAGNSQFQIRYLNPIIIFHDLFAWDDYPRWRESTDDPDERIGDMIGSIASIEINWNVFKNFSVYAQWVMNELTFSGESDGHPNGLGYMIGVQYAHSFKSWGSVYYLEFIYTDPYLSILSSPFASFIQMDRMENYYHIGFPRDSISISAGANFFYNDTLNIFTNFSWIASGQHNMEGLIWNWNNTHKERNERTPSGIAENKYILSLGAGWKPLPYLVLKTSITGIVSVNNFHTKNGTALGGQASFSVGITY